MKKNYFTNVFLDRNTFSIPDFSLGPSFYKNLNYKCLIFMSNKVFYDSKTKKPLWLNKLNYKNILDKADIKIYLGKDSLNIYLAIEINKKILSNNKKIFQNFFLEDIKIASKYLPKKTIGIIGYAKSLLAWNKKNSYCSNCGSKTILKDKGHSKECINKSCETKYFPKLDPAVIMLITYKNKCLLARQKDWPKNMYSALAGFVEHGESIEETVKRETYEEVGIIIKNIKYQHSQSWPFPHTLMLGFRAKAYTSKLKIDKKEIHIARWYTKKQIKEKVNAKCIVLPSKISISYRLIEEWLNE